MVREEVLAVLLLTVLLMILMGTCLYVTRPTRARSAAGDEREPPPADPESLEGALVAYLVAGAISRRQYRRAMERVAARDEERHPWTVPPA